MYRVGLAGATDVSGLPESFTVVRGGSTVQVSLDQMTPAELAAAGVQPIAKSVHVDLNAVGYNRVSNPEGLAFIDATTIAVINDNDFSVPAITIDPATGLFTRVEEPDPVLLGIIRLNPPAAAAGAPMMFGIKELTDGDDEGDVDVLGPLGP